MPFPSILSTFNRPATTDRLNSPSHSALHNTVSSALGQVEAVIGVEGASSVVGTLQYLIKSPASDGGGHVQTAVKGGTGQTTYTKGDLLVAQSASVLSKLAVTANDGLALVADSTQSTGIKWGNFPTPTVRAYSTPSILTWNKPSTLSYIVVEVQAGGGNGADSSGANNGGGGGGGGYSRKVIAASSLGVTETIQVGSVAGYSSFGSHAVTTAAANASGSAGGAGGTGSNGDINIAGSPGGSEIGGIAATISVSNAGGGSQLGRGGVGGVTTSASAASNGSNALGYGGGGGGGAGATDNSPTGSGGTGTSGIVIVTEY